MGDAGGQHAEGREFFLRDDLVLHRLQAVEGFAQFARTFRHLLFEGFVQRRVFQRNRELGREHL